MKPKNPAAVSLGKLARGVPKSFTQAELDRRRKRLADARVKRWPKRKVGK